MNENKKVEHQSDLDTLEKALLETFEMSANSAKTSAMSTDARASFASAAAELATAIVEIRKQREFEALPAKDKGALRLPAIKATAI